VGGRETKGRGVRGGKPISKRGGFQLQMGFLEKRKTNFDHYYY